MSKRTSDHPEAAPRLKPCPLPDDSQDIWQVFCDCELEPLSEAPSGDLTSAGEMWGNRAKISEEEHSGAVGASAWAEFEWLVDEVAPTLPSPLHVAVLLCCFHYWQGIGEFRVSTPRIAEACNLQKRRTRYLLDDLEKLGVLEMVEDHKGPIPRLYRIAF